MIPQKTVLNLFGFSKAAFHYHLNQIKQSCLDSPLSLCLSRHPAQLSVREINTMKELLLNETMKCWPIASIAWYAKRSGQIIASLSVWYKYAKILGLNRKAFKILSKTKTGLKSYEPNQYLHIDTTFYTLVNGVKYAIVFVTDNFSRAILGWSVSTNKGSGNVIKALRMAIKTIKKHYPQLYASLLLADQGSENNNYQVDSFLLLKKAPEIHKLIAQKQIKYSNSSIEAVNKIFKRYMSIYQPDNYLDLINCIRYFVHDYDDVRPHVSLNGLTPMEVYTGNIPELNLSEKLKIAGRNRIVENKDSSCGIC